MSGRGFRAGAGLRLAAGTLTVVPVGDLGEIDRGAARAAMTLATIAVLPLGLLTAGVVAGGDAMGLPPLFIGALVVAALAWGTRGMHIDGFADTVDGMGAGWDPRRALEIMHRGDVGPMGAAGLVVLLLAQAVGFAQVATMPWGWALAGAAVVAGRCGLVIACLRGVPPASESRMGQVMASTIHPLLALVVAAVIGTGLVPLGLAAGLPWWQPLSGLAVALVAVALLIRKAVKVFGGVTGDVMGASIEVCMTVLLIALCAGAVHG